MKHFKQIKFNVLGEGSNKLELPVDFEILTIQKNPNGGVYLWYQYEVMSAQPMFFGTEEFIVLHGEDLYVSEDKDKIAVYVDSVPSASGTAMKHVFHVTTNINHQPAHVD